MFRLATKSAVNQAEENFLEQEEPEFHPSEADPAVNDHEMEAPSRFLDQFVICVICLIALLFGMKSREPHIQWVRDRLHTAIDTSTEATFGTLGRSPFLQGLIRTSKDLIKFEEITEPLREGKGANFDTTTAAPGNLSFPGCVWPANGNVTRSFGWQYNPLSHAREFNSGIEITATAGDLVHALNRGEVVEIARQGAQGWQVSLNHGGGWVSIYRNLGGVKVQIGQKVAAGSLIGSLQSTENNRAPFWLEIKYEDQPIDPLSLFTT